MFVLHSDCYKLSKKCQYCCSIILEYNNTAADGGSSDSSNNDQLDASRPPPPQEEDNRSSIITTTTSSMNPDDRRMESLSELPEPKKQRTLMMENDPQEITSIIMEAVVADVVEEGVASSDNNLIVSSVVATTAEPKYNRILTSSEDKDEKIELELKEEKSPATMSADLLTVNFDSSLIYNQSHIEAIVQCHTFIGSASRSSSKEDSSAVIGDAITNVEYQGDNIVGCFDQNGNHIIGSSGQRRLFGPVYTVRKYRPSTDEEMVYAVIIWTDAAVKDKIEIEITSFDDYFELVNLS